jgi:TnpA family transposase
VTGLGKKEITPFPLALIIHNSISQHSNYIASWVGLNCREARISVTRLIFHLQVGRPSTLLNRLIIFLLFAFGLVL